MISIVTAYYNRKELFYQTLKSITKSNYKDIEVIVVDDGSDPEYRLEDLIDEFPFLKIIRLERENRWYINPCVPFNIGIRESKGDIIVLQNPECFHVHDILTNIVNKVNDTTYVTISAYAITPDMNNKLKFQFNNNTHVNYFNTFPQHIFTGYHSGGWYNHSRYRPVGYHFCSGITRLNMKKINGFDERYAHGFGYDDDEFIARILRLGLNITIENDISVIHQYHDTVTWNQPNADILTEKNRKLFHLTTLKEKEYKSNNFVLIDDNE